MPTRVSDSETQEQVPSSSRLLPGRREETNNEISLLDLLIVIAERKRIVIWITTSFSIAAVVISLLLPKEYTATVTVLPPQQNSSLSAILASQLGNLGSVTALAGNSLGLKNPNDLYVSMLKSRTVEDAIIDRFGLMRLYHVRYPSDARKQLEHRTVIDDSNKDGLLYISVEDQDPNRATEMANGFVAQFRKLSEHLAITEASQRRLFFERQLEQTKNQLANAEEALKQTEQTTGLVQLDSQARALIESTAALRAQVSAKEVQIKAMQTYATGENAQLIQAEQELSSLKAQLVKLGGSESEDSSSLILPKGRVPEAGLEYMRKVRDVKYYETIFEILAKQFEVAKLDEAKEGSMIQIVDPAIVPDRRSSPKRALIVLGSTVFGFFVGIFAAFLVAGLQRSSENAEVCAKLRLLREKLTVKKSTAL